MSLSNASLSNGVWTNNMYPPKTIAANGDASWQSESDGFLTGTEGTVTYYLANFGDVKVSWNDPYSGSNTYGQSAPKDYSISHSGGSGNNTQVTFTLT